MTHLAFIDTETTGLDLVCHDIWELALIIRGHPSTYYPDGEYVWQFPVNLSLADPMALKISGWYERSLQWRTNSIDPASAHTVAGVHPNGEPFADSRSQSGIDHVLRHIADLLRGAHLVGAVPDFDAYRLQRLLNRNNLLPTWHYHLIDIEALMVGYLHGKNQQEIYAYHHRTEVTKVSDAVFGSLFEPGKLWIELPWKSDDLSRSCNVDPPSDSDRHTALGDARWAARVYDKVTG